MGFFDRFKSKKRLAYEAAMKESQAFLDGKKPDPERNKDQAQERLSAARPPPLPTGWASMLERTEAHLRKHECFESRGGMRALAREYDWTDSGRISREGQDQELEECLGSLRRMAIGDPGWNVARKVASAYLHLLVSGTWKEISRGSYHYQPAAIVQSAGFVRREAERAKRFHDEAIEASPAPPFEEGVLAEYRQARADADRIFEDSRERAEDALGQEMEIISRSLMPLLEGSKPYEIGRRVELVGIMIDRVRAICKTYGLAEPADLRGIEERLDRYRR